VKRCCASNRAINSAGLLRSVVEVWRGTDTILISRLNIRLSVKWTFLEFRCLIACLSIIELWNLPLGSCCGGFIHLWYRWSFFLNPPLRCFELINSVLHRKMKKVWVVWVDEFLALPFWPSSPRETHWCSEIKSPFFGKKFRVIRNPSMGMWQNNSWWNPNKIIWSRQLSFESNSNESKFKNLIFAEWTRLKN